jgi:hypothetical protein
MIRVVGGENCQFFIVVTVIDDIKNHLLHPGRRPLGPQFIQDKNILVEDGFQDFRFGYRRIGGIGVLDLPDKFPKIAKITRDIIFLDHLVDQGDSQVGLSYPTGADKQKAHILDRIIFHELLGYLDSMFMGIVMDLEIFERTVFISFRYARLLDKELPFSFLETAASAGNHPAVGVLKDPAGAVAMRARIARHQFRYPLNC